MIKAYLKRGALGLALGLAIVSLATDWLSPRVVASSPADNQAEGSQAAEKTVDEARKNIQVLKGLPDSQLRPMMNLFAASLGVTCAHCHVRTGNQWEFEKDDKKNKQTARKMIRMTMELNKNSFEGKPEVSCYTCHQGVDHPVIVPSLPLPARARGAGAGPAEAWATPQETLAKYEQAMGGKEAAGKVKTRMLKGSYITANGSSSPLEVRMAAPDKVLAIVTTQRQGTIYQGLDGNAGWTKSDRGQEAMNSVETDRMKSLAWSLEALPLKEPYPRLTFAGKEKIGGREANMFRTALPDKRRAWLFFDSETGLLLRRIVWTITIAGPDPEQIDFEDYREVDGVKAPFTIRASYLDSGASATYKFEEVKHNVPVDEAQFRSPAARQ